MSAAPGQMAEPSLASRLGQVRVGLRQDLEVSRHLFRGAPSYIVRDPVTFQSQRLDPADYDVFVSLDPSRPLRDVFSDLHQRKKLTDADEEPFYEFVMGLHRHGFLRLPISDDKLLYQRHQMKQRAKRKEKMLGFLFLRIPVWNPNAFLGRTIRYARPVFGKAFLALWLVVMASAGFIVIGNWGELAEPLQGLLATRNLVVMWITLIVLKVFHEFGHAYACKHYGGHVPEMGIYLILFTPCAYMDATASWGFTRKRERLIVCLGGMYIESFIAGIATFIWALTGPSFLHSLAYNIMFLASVVTALFNINPLMRFDGYFIMSDLTEVPNLRSRSSQYVLSILKRVALGLPSKQKSEGGRLGALLFSYGVAVTLYRMALLLSISAMLAVKMFVVGLGLAVVYLGSTVVTTLRKLTKYLWYAEECAAVRGRAVVVSVLALIVLPGTLILIPVPSHVQAVGLLTNESETIVRARATGVIEAAAVECGQVIAKGDLLVRLANDEYLESVATAQADLRASQIRRDAYRINEPGKALQEGDRAEAYGLALRRHQARLADLHVRAPVAGRVVQCLRETDIGSFVREGDPVASIVSGSWQVRSILTEQEIASAKPRVGDPVTFRAAAAAAATVEGVIVRIAAAGSRIITLTPLTHLGGGDIAVNPETGEAPEPYVELTIALHSDAAQSFRHGMTGYVRLKGSAVPVAATVYRRLTRFVNRLMQE